jgi:hypothetical protein
MTITMNKGIFLVFLLATSPLFAECIRDLEGRTVCGHGPCAKDWRGDVYCARDRYGTATHDDRGNVVCGLGKCAKDIRGNTYCSTESGGDAILNDRGGIDCFGACQLANGALCEQILAGQR